MNSIPYRFHTLARRRSGCPERDARAGRTVALLLACVGLSIGHSALARAADPNWRAVRGEAGECRLEAAEAVVSDGYDQTPVRLTLRDGAFFVATESNLDLGDQGLGLHVDRHPPVPIAEPVGLTGARLAADLGKLVPLMIRGRKAELRLKFWPTWPATGVKKVPYSLIGFTKAYRQFEACKGQGSETQE